jgi:hypothetical protein
MSARLVTVCGLCGGDRLELVLSLGSSPPTCAMQVVGARQASEDHYPLDLLRCHDCSLVQLSVVVDPAVVFPADYPYSSGNSRALHANFEDLARQANLWHNGLGLGDLVVDIGANDGTLLGKFPVACRTEAVEPTEQIAKWLAQGGQGYMKPFSEALARRIVSECGHAKVVTACNVLAHVEDIHDVMRGITTLLADDGILIAEVHDLEKVVEGGQWDTVYHEHLRYWDSRTFHRLFVEHGLWAEDWQDIPTHGGSFRVMARLAEGDIVDGPIEYDWPAFRARASSARWALRSAVSATRHGGKRVGGIGATARATTIINACGFDVDDIEAVYEVAGSDKIGRYIPGTAIPVVDEAVLRESHAPGTCILFAWYMAEHVIPKLRGGQRGYRGTLIKPLPDFEYLRHGGRAGTIVNEYHHP